MATMRPALGSEFAPKIARAGPRGAGSKPRVRRFPVRRGSPVASVRS